MHHTVHALRTAPPRARSTLNHTCTCAGAGNDYNKDKQFRKLNAQKDTIMIKVLRNGEHILVVNHDVVVGDVMILDTGDKIIADGIVIHSFGLVVDEASLTGESDPIKKNKEEDPWVRSGTQVRAQMCVCVCVCVCVCGGGGGTHIGCDMHVAQGRVGRKEVALACWWPHHPSLHLVVLIHVHTHTHTRARNAPQVSEGSGHLLVLAVGPNSEWGKTMELVGQAGDENTPLQDKLEDVAAAVGKVGLGVAIACFVAMLIK